MTVSEVNNLKVINGRFKCMVNDAESIDMPIASVTINTLTQLTGLIDKALEEIGRGTDDGR